MTQLAVVLLALFAQMERTHNLERAGGSLAAATAKGRRIGRPTVVDPDKLAYATHQHDTGHTITEIVTKSGITRTSLYRHLPPRPGEPLYGAAVRRWLGSLGAAQGHRGGPSTPPLHSDRRCTHCCPCQPLCPLNTGGTQP
jgi:hypothetical protein